MSKLKKLGPTLLACLLAMCLLCGTAFAFTGFSITHTEGETCTNFDNASTLEEAIAHLNSNHTAWNISDIRVSSDQTLNADAPRYICLDSGTLTVTGQQTNYIHGHAGNLVVANGLDIQVSGTFDSITTQGNATVTLVGDTTISGGTAKVTTGTGFDYGLTVNGETANVTMDGGAHLEWAKVSNGSLDLCGAQIANGSADNSGYGLQVTGGTVKSTSEGYGYYPGNTNFNYIHGVNGGVYITDGTITGFFGQEIKCTGTTGSALVSAGGTSAFTDCWFAVAAGNTNPVVNVTGGNVTIQKDADGTSKISGNEADKNVALYATNAAAVITLKGAEVLSYNDNYAVYILGGATGLFTDGTTVTSHGEKGVYVNEAGTFTANSTNGVTTTITAKVYGIYLNGNAYGVTAVGNLGDGAEIDMNTDATGVCYGVYATASDAVFNQTGGEINAQASTNGGYAYGVYVTGSGTATMTGGQVNVSAASANITGAKLWGMYNDSGKTTQSGGVITVDTQRSSNDAIGLYNKSTRGVSTVSGGEIHVTGSGSGNTALGIQSNTVGTTTRFTGGTVSMTGDICKAVYVSKGLFEMGVHEQAALPAVPGTAYTDGDNPGNPYIYITNAANSHGVYAIDAGQVKLFAGTIENSGGNGTYGVFVDASANVQVLTNAHNADPAVGDENITFTVDVANGPAFSANGGYFAIRGRGSVFTGSPALYVADADMDDNGYWHDENCENTQGTAYAPLSGGTFIANRGGNSIIVGGNAGDIGDLILGNHYLRDAVKFNGAYTAPSDGTYDVEEALYGEFLTAQTVTVTDAEWELRYALEDDNTVNDYYMPIDIELDYADEVHGTGPEDGDVDVDTAGTKADVHKNEGAHTLDLMARTLSYDGPDTNLTTEPTPAVPSVIEVSDGGALNTVASGRSALADSPYTTTGVIKFGDTVNGVAVHVTGGVYANGTPYYEDEAGALVMPDDGAILKGTANGNAGSYNLRVSGGRTGLFSGMVGWENSSHTSVYVDGGELFVNGGGVYGNLNADTSMGIYAVGGKTVIAGGTVKGDLQGYRAKDVYVNGADAQVLAATAYANDIGNVVVEAGRFDLVDGTYETGEGDVAKLVPTEIQSLRVTGGSAYVDGGVVLNDSAVTGGELLVDDGVFKNDLAISGGSTVFAPWYDEDETTGDEIMYYGKVEGTVSVTSADGSLLVDYADIQTVSTTTDGSSVALHGGLYGTITTTYTDGENDIISNGEYIGGFVAGAEVPGMIPVNHALTAQGTSSYLRSDAASVSAHATDTAKRMEIVAIDLNTILAQNVVQLPCNIDLNYADGGKVEWSFRDGINDDLTMGADGDVICGEFQFTGPWVIEEGQTKTLNLNGYYLTDSADNGVTISVEGGNLTVRDGYTAKPDGAVIEFADLYDEAVAIRMDAGSLTVNSGAVISESVGGAAIYAVGGNIAVTGTAKITGAEEGIHYGTGAGSVSVSGTPVITGIGGDGLYYDGGSGNVTVSGGTFISEYDDGDYAGIYYDGIGTLTISGGSFDNTEADEGYGVIVTTDDATVNISGGVFGENSTGGLLVEDAAKVSLTGGKYKSIVNAIDTDKPLSDFIASNTTVTAERMEQEGETTAAPTPTDGLDGFLEQINNFQPTTPSTVVPRTPANAGDASLEDSALAQIDGVHQSQITVVEEKTFTTGEAPDTATETFTFTTVWNYMPMYTLTTGGYFPPTPSEPTPPLETKDHFAYVQGYPDGSFRPEGNITRDEAAMMFYSLLVDKSYSGTIDFEDVPASHWAYKPIQALAAKGIIEGYPNGEYMPDGQITRAEFCTLASRFFTLTNGQISFADVPANHWAYKYIASAAGYGWIEEGETMFRPDEAITRAEAVVIVNNMLGRDADKAYVDANLSAKYPDVSKDHVAYYDIMEASFGHNYNKTGDKETWTGLQ